MVKHHLQKDQWMSANFFVYNKLADNGIGLKNVMS